MHFPSSRAYDHEINFLLRVVDNSEVKYPSMTLEMLKIRTNLVGDLARRTQIDHIVPTLRVLLQSAEIKDHISIFLKLSDSRPYYSPDLTR